ncbi:Inositol-1-monophosphatase [Mycolicibacterium vanbaalenii]|uniref:Inositol-1-monophosphatase n=1 Tax=Mycolicibacterium vanbaalenii TaxID=110539 RepID=A0A5S9R450_MYCVN|nr:inositol monophosphatase family protein [Mycolicibacterium vanbaalenii]CAA0129485.1 Inositol-1-monophosphatase [Mycolicibacterium vanbaalenii]
MSTAAGLRELAVTAARYGAGVCLRRSTEGGDVVTKGAAGDLVTAVDRAAEEAVRQVLLDARPDDALLGEELPAHPGSSGLQWVIDPLDGTTNFTRRIPFYGTSVGVRDGDGVWLAAAVCAPVLDTTWSAARGTGAQVETASGREDLPLALATSSASVLGTGLSYDATHRRRQLRELGWLMVDYTDMRRFGAAAIDLCLVAQGSLDAFVEDDLGVHDWAAGALIAEEAGAQVHRPTDRDATMSAHWR